MTSELGNLVKISDDRAVIKYNPNIYDVETINAVAHFMIGKCNTFIDEDEDKKIIVEIFNCNSNIEDCINEFNEEVINYSFYSKSMKDKYILREAVLKRVLKCTG